MTMLNFYSPHYIASGMKYSVAFKMVNDRSRRSSSMLKIHVNILTLNNIISLPLD